MMNAVGGTTLHYWAQSWRLNPWDFKVVSETTRRYGASRIPKGSTVEDWPFGLDELEPHYDKVEYEVGVSGQAGNINGKIDRARQHLRGRAQARHTPMPPLRGTGFTRQDGGGARIARLAPVSGTGGDQLAPYAEPLGVHVSRLLQPRRLPRRREELDRGRRPFPRAQATGHLEGRDAARTSRRSRSTATAA